MIANQESGKVQVLPALKLTDAIVSTPQQQQPAKSGLKTRHKLLLLSFFLLVLLPAAIGSSYLFFRAAPQFNSSAAFSVRSENVGNPLDALSAITQIGSSSASDSVVLYDSIRSQPMMLKLDAKLDLRSIYNRDPDDFIFSLGTDITTEDLLDYWDRMVSVSIDESSGILELETFAFQPEDANLILAAILEECSKLVDDLSRIAQADAMKYAVEDLTTAEERLRATRRRIAAFRVENEMIDPSADAGNHMTVLSALQSQLAEALVGRESLNGYAGVNDPRIAERDRMISAIQKQIELVRSSVSQVTDGRSAFSDVMGRYEELLVDLQFSQDAYTAARASEELARAEARRRNRYLAVHIPPTTAEESLYPRRFLLSGLLLACCFAAWSVLALIYYNVRDRS
jgi:capsular polysaccharide transport system permease protein